MKKEVRKVVYAGELGLESYYLQGTTHAFPRHFHEYYVLGLVESGQRRLFCNDKCQDNCTLHRGDILLFNPGDNHACVQLGQEAFAYRGINISQQVMLDWTEEISGRRELPGFSQNVIYDKEISVYWRWKKSGCFCLICLSKNIHILLLNVCRNVGRRLIKPVLLWSSIWPSTSV